MIAAALVGRYRQIAQFHENERLIAWQHVLPSLAGKRALVAADWHKLWSLLGARLVYCFLLASGIAISMLRQQRRRGKSGTTAVLPSGGVRRLRRIACVWTFFAVINFWNVLARLTIAERTRLFLTLFGL